MNKARRKELNKALELLAQAREIIEAVQEEEQESFDNMPEGLQVSELGEKIEENAYTLEDIASTVEDVEGQIDELING